MNIKKLIFIVAMGAFVAMAALLPSYDPTLDVDGYFVPLTGGFGIVSSWRQPGMPSDGTFLGRQQEFAPYLIRGPIYLPEDAAATRPSENGIDLRTVFNIGKVAVVSPLIVGMAGKEYFIFDTSSIHSDDDPLIARKFSSRDLWAKALADAGIRPSPELLDPSHFTKGVADTIIHPNHYRVMKALLGWSDDSWARSIFFFFATMMLLLALLPQKRRILLPAILLGVTSAFLVDEYLGEGGPELLAGLFCQPIDFLLVGYIARLIRWAAIKIVAKKPTAVATG